MELSLTDLQQQNDLYHLPLPHQRIYPTLLRIGLRMTTLRQMLEQAMTFEKEAREQSYQPVVQWCEQCGELVTDFCRGKGGKCGYGFQRPGQATEPAPSTAGELTDEQLWDIWNAQGSDQMDKQEAFTFARAILAAARTQPVREPLTAEELELCRQWFNNVQDVNGGYLTPDDYMLAEKLYGILKIRCPKSITDVTNGITNKATKEQSND